ncbi:hypothetical protein EPUL_006745, partial [Erysiphe pulchra]
ILVAVIDWIKPLLILLNCGHFNLSRDISDLPATDLYVHKVKLKEGIKPHHEKLQRRWPRDKLWWLNKIIQEGWDCGMYEPTTARKNGEGFSPWNAQANLTPKSDESKWSDEPRITFNYHFVNEELPAVYMPL